MSAPPPGAQISEDGFYWWNENTGDPNQPARWELLADPAAAASSTAAAQGAAAAQPQSQDAAHDPSQQQSTTGDVTLEWQYTADDELSVALDELVASGWEPGSEDEMA